MINGLFSNLKNSISNLFGFNKNNDNRPKFSDIHRRVSEQSYNSNPESNLDGYTLISSTPENIAYKKGNDIIVGNRGTSNFSDVITDAKVFFGNDLSDTGRYKRSEEFLNRIRNENKDSNISLTGHSLGGGIANKLSEKYGLKSNVYNPYIGYGGSGDLSGNTNVSRTAFDLASLPIAFKDGVKTIWNSIPSGISDLFKQHSLSNFQ